MKILFKSREDLTKQEIYKMTKNAEIEQMKNVTDREMLEISAYIVFEDENADGEVNKIHSILTTDGRAIAFQSKTFAKSLEDIAEIMTGGNWNEPFSIIKISGKTKSGRDFINCALA